MVRLHWAGVPSLCPSLMVVWGSWLESLVGTQKRHSRWDEAACGFSPFLSGDGSCRHSVLRQETFCDVGSGGAKDLHMQMGGKAGVWENSDCLPVGCSLTGTKSGGPRKCDPSTALKGTPGHCWLVEHELEAKRKGFGGMWAVQVQAKPGRHIFLTGEVGGAGRMLPPLFQHCRVGGPALG